LFSSQLKIVGASVVVNLVSGNAVSGVCAWENGRAVILRGATVHSPGSDPAPADGEVLIERTNIDFVQRLRGGARCPSSPPPAR